MFSFKRSDISPTACFILALSGTVSAAGPLHFLMCRIRTMLHIIKMQLRGVITGYGDGSFKPDNYVSWKLSPWLSVPWACRMKRKRSIVLMSAMICLFPECRRLCKGCFAAVIDADNFSRTTAMMAGPAARWLSA